MNGGPIPRAKKSLSAEGEFLHTEGQESVLAKLHNVACGFNAFISVALTSARRSSLLFV